MYQYNHNYSIHIVKSNILVIYIDPHFTNFQLNISSSKMVLQRLQKAKVYQKGMMQYMQVFTFFESHFSLRPYLLFLIVINTLISAFSLFDI